MKRNLSEEERRKQERKFVEDTWLYYINQYLYDHGTISAKEYKKMIDKIATRKKSISSIKGAM